MDISALLTATAGTGKAANSQPGGKLTSDGAFAEQLNQAAHAAGLTQLLGASHAKPGANGGGELPADLAALAERLVEGIANEVADGDGQAEALALIEGVLDEAAADPHGEAPLAALEALLNGDAQANHSLPGAVSLDAGEESALLAEVRQRMALIDAAGRPLATPGQGLSNPSSSQRPGAELAALQARALGQAEGDTRQPRATSDALLLDPAAAREAKPAGREALAEITQQALRSAAQAAPAASPGAAATPQPAAGQPQPGSEAPLFAALNGRSEAPSAASGEANGMPAAPAASAQGTTASPQPLGQPLANPNSAALSAPVASQQWQQQLGQQLINLTQRGEQRVELRLNPAELGPLSVSLKLGENGAQAQFLSAHAQVRGALEQAIPQLREALEEQGISLSEATVGEHAGGQQGEMTFANGGGSGQHGGSASGSEDKVLGDTAEALPDRPLELDGRVDLYA
nr:flagellar hook-length control protein FliK [Halomonas socia]